MLKMRNLAVAIGAAVALGAASQAMAAPGVFTVDPTVYSGGSGAQFDADLVSGTSSALITATGGGTYTSEGWLNFNGFSLLGSAVGAGTHRLTVDYGLYAVFTQTFQCAGSLSINTTCSVTGIDLSVYVDPGWTNTFTQAVIGTAPSVTDNGAADVLLATANVVYAGVAGLDALGGAFENVTTNFVLTAAGSTYFIDPVPFYNFAFSTFNNTSQGIACDPANCQNVTQLAITQEVGATDFIAAVPEPASLALMGIALAALGVSRRRKA